MRFYDNHTHSHFSPDCRMTMEESLKGAVKANLAGIGITDHLDIDAPDGKDMFVFDPLEQQNTIAKLSSEFEGLEILRGIEVGLQPECMEKIKGFTSKYTFDVVIASIHFIDGTDPYYGKYYEGKDYREAYSRAFEIMYKTAVEYSDFDILGHFDYIARYAPYSVRDIKYREFADVLDPILRFIANEGKALEVNTNTYRERNGYTPSLDTDILKRFKELGGEAISLGSDAHEAWRVAENFEKYRDIIKSCGFNRLVCFKERKAVFYNI